MAVRKHTILFILIFLSCSAELLGQCNALRPQIDISFNTDQDCAPVTVTGFDVTYYFNVAQDPNDIQIQYEWNDPAGTITTIGLANGLTTNGTNTSFTANAGLTYFDNNDECSIRPTTTIIIGGVACPSSRQTQTAFFWGTDEQANGVVSMSPQEWEVCFNNPVANAVFRDNSDFNCNINIEPDNPNRFSRHVQFVYGTNHNTGTTISNLTLNDGTTVALTNGTGNLANTVVRGSGAMQITGGYFGPIEPVPFPADDPTAFTFPMNAPADMNNAIGNRFEITMFNWNICNPWNGDNVNPNYEDAVLTRGYITIVAAPAPDFETRDKDGNVTSNFCIDETIFFGNVTANLSSNSYTWEFYDDAAGLSLAGTSTQTNPTFAYTSGGQKLIRLIAENTTAQSSCIEEITKLVNITPSLIATIMVTDLTNVPTTTEFCQQSSSPFTQFNVRFTDASIGSATPSTQWRWEFYDENNALVFDAPSGGAFSNAILGPFDRVFTNKGIYKIVLRIKDNLTSCETTDEVFVKVFEKPIANFTASRVCDGSETVFQDFSTINPVDGDQIISWEWDMDYDGASFNKNGSLDGQKNFNFLFPAAGSYNVALQVTTDKGCSEIFSTAVIVDAVPQASIASDKTTGCSVLSVNFTNESIVGQPDIVKDYIWEIDAGSGYVTDSIQHPSDPGFSALFTKTFENVSTTDLVYSMRLRVITVNSCEDVSDPIVITVKPGTSAGFSSLNYSPFNDNCSPVSVNFSADSETQSLNPVNYTWTIKDSNETIERRNTNTTPTLSFLFENDTTVIKDFYVTLRATLASGCYGDSTRIIRVNPLPPAAFDVDTLLYDCDKIRLQVEALQKGLPKYQWTILINNVIIYNGNTFGDAFEYEFLRSTIAQQEVKIQLVTTNLANCQSLPAIEEITIIRSDDISPGFTVTPRIQTLPNTTVNIINTTNPGPWKYKWDFGDGTISEDPLIASHTYETFGNYTIKLEVTNDDCVETVITLIQINPAIPILDFEYDPASGCAPLTVNFTNLSKYADASSYHWKFGSNEGTSYAVNPSYTYYEPGIYSVTLSAANNFGDTIYLTKQLIIEVYEKPSAQFNVKPKLIYVPGGKLFTDNQSFGASSFEWNFGDGFTSNEFEPQHEYKEEGIFDITLIAVSAEGCADTTTLEAAVKTESSAQLLVPNAFSPNLSGPGNSQGQNDVFKPILRGVSNYQMMVFNRWGQLLFETTDPDRGWDGYFQGKLCQQDVYVYKIVAESADGQQLTRAGDIHLIR
jgi:gliding motility-associated-like protein